MMFVFEVATWVLFGVIAGLWADWFMRSPHHAVQLSAFGVAGALLGGFLGRATIPTSHEAWVGHFNVAALLLAVFGAILAVSIDWFAFRRKEAGFRARHKLGRLGRRR